MAKKISCEGTKIKARYEEAQLRYEAEFNKKDDGWGKVIWEPLGEVTQWEKPAKAKVALKALKEPALQKAPVAEAPAAVIKPVSAPVVILTPAPAPISSPLKFSGFFDSRYTNFSAPNNPNVANANAESGFGIEDGAFYLNYEKDKLAIVVDVAFRRGKDKDTNANATKPEQSSNNTVAIGVDKSQFYLRYKITPDLVFDLGQFDTIFGVEVNDSKDRVFGKTGLVYDAMIPLTHTGAMLEYTLHSFSFKVFGADPNNKGSNGSSTTGDERTEYAGSVGFANEKYRSQIAYMLRPMTKSGSTDLGSRSLADLTLGATLGAFAIDLEYALIDDPSKNTLTPLNVNDHEAPGSGFLALGTYKLNDAWLFGLRFEKLKDDPANSSAAGTIVASSAMSYGGSVHYKLNSDIETRAEYTGYQYNDLNSKSWNDSRFSVAALVFF